MRCPVCSKMIPDASRYCGYCGAATRPKKRKTGSHGLAVHPHQALDLAGVLGIVGQGLIH